MIRIYLAGDMAIEHPGGLVRDDRLPGLQGRIVLAVLAAESHRSVGRDELEVELWPDGSPGSVEVAIRAVVSKVRGALGEAGLDGDGLSSAFGAYRLHLPAHAWVDVPAAFDAIHRAEPALRDGDLSDAVGWGRVVVSIASRPLLTGASGPWVERTRERLREAHVRALDCLTHVWLATGDPAQAARDAANAASLDPFREPSHRLLIRALAASGDRAGALRAYEQLRELLAAELGADPSPETQAMHLAVLRGQPIPSG